MRRSEIAPRLFTSGICDSFNVLNTKILELSGKEVKYSFNRHVRADHLHSPTYANNKRKDEPSPVSNWSTTSAIQVSKIKCSPATSSVSTNS